MHSDSIHQPQFLPSEKWEYLQLYRVFGGVIADYVYAKDIKQLKVLLVQLQNIILMKIHLSVRFPIFSEMILVFLSVAYLLKKNAAVFWYANLPTKCNIHLVVLRES